MHYVEGQYTGLLARFLYAFGYRIYGKYERNYSI